MKAHRITEWQCMARTVLSAVCLASSAWGSWNGAGVPDGTGGTNINDTANWAGGVIDGDFSTIIQQGTTQLVLTDDQTFADVDAVSRSGISFSSGSTALSFTNAREIGALNRAWGSRYAGWDDLLKSEAPPSANAGEDCREFTRVMIDRYFASVRDEFKAAAPDSLYLGCRFLEKGSEFALRVAAKYCDVLSFNAYQDSLDSFALPSGVDRPVLIAEFHFGALDRGQLNEGLWAVPDQKARGAAYEAYVSSALRHAAIVGAHWHQYGDQPVVGRYDGENFQDGLVDVCDLPYRETVAGVRAVGYRLYELRSNR